MLLLSVRNMVSRSMPSPKPPVGGRPYSKAVQKFSSTYMASSSPAALSWSRRGKKREKSGALFTCGNEEKTYRKQHCCALGQGKGARNISFEYRTVPSFTRTRNSRLGTPSTWSLARLLSWTNNVLWYINIMVGILLKENRDFSPQQLVTSTLHVHHCKCESLWVYITSIK